MGACIGFAGGVGVLSIPSGGLGPGAVPVAVFEGVIPSVYAGFRGGAAGFWRDGILARGVTVSGFDERGESQVWRGFAGEVTGC